MTSILNHCEDVPGWQDRPLQPLSSFFQEKFNDLNSLPMQVWLTNLKPNSEETARMHMLGNIVVPCQAELACRVLHSMSVDR